MALASISSLGTFVPDNLIAACADVHVGNVTIAAGNALKRGTVLSKDADSGECSMLASGGSVYAILADDVDASDAAVTAEAYLSGSFHYNALIAGEDVTLSDYADAARELGIYFVTSVPYDGSFEVASESTDSDGDTTTD